MNKTPKFKTVIISLPFCFAQWVAFLAMCLTGICLQAQTGERLKNSDIVSLKAAGFSDELIIEKIRNAKQTSFDTSLEGLKMLKAAAISEQVIKSIIENSVSAAAYSNSDNPGDIHQPGLYVQAADRDGRARMIMLEHARSGGSLKGGNALGGVGKGLGMALGGPMAMGGTGKKKIKATLNGPRSAIQIIDRNPTFYIYTTTDTQHFGGDDLSVNDFELVQLKATDKTREIMIGKTGAYGTGESTYGVDEKARQAVSVEKMRDGIYLVKLIRPLQPGEYAFEHLTDGVFYDFGVADLKK